MDAVAAHDREIVGYALERFAELDDVQVHGPKDPSRRIALASFELDGVHPHDVAEILGSQGVCVRAGHHCAQPLMRRLGVPASSRASFAIHTTREDVDRLDRRAGPRPGYLRLMDKVKLHRCSCTFLHMDMDACWKVQRHLDEQGIPYEVVKHGYGKGKRPEVEQLSGQSKLPVIEFPTAPPTARSPPTWPPASRPAT